MLFSVLLFVMICSAREYHGPKSLILVLQYCTSNQESYGGFFHLDVSTGNLSLDSAGVYPLELVANCFNTELEDESYMYGPYLGYTFTTYAIGHQRESYVAHAHFFNRLGDARVQKMSSEYLAGILNAGFYPESGNPRLYGFGFNSPDHRNYCFMSVDPFNGDTEKIKDLPEDFGFGAGWNLPSEQKLFLRKSGDDRDTYLTLDGKTGDILDENYIDQTKTNVVFSRDCNMTKCVIMYHNYTYDLWHFADMELKTGEVTQNQEIDVRQGTLSATQRGSGFSKNHDYVAIMGWDEVERTPLLQVFDVQRGFVVLITNLPQLEDVVGERIENVHPVYVGFDE